jgi:hypothetical protein
VNSRCCNNAFGIKHLIFRNIFIGSNNRHLFGRQCCIRWRNIWYIQSVIIFFTNNSKWYFNSPIKIIYSLFFFIYLVIHNNFNLVVNALISFCALLLISIFAIIASTSLPSFLNCSVSFTKLLISSIISCVKYISSYNQIICVRQVNTQLKIYPNLVSEPAFHPYGIEQLYVKLALFPILRFIFCVQFRK